MPTWAPTRTPTRQAVWDEMWGHTRQEAWKGPGKDYFGGGGEYWGTFYRTHQLQVK